MKIIKELSEHIEDELDCAEEYILAAVRVKEDYPEVAKVYYNLSVTAMDNITQLHTVVSTIIMEYRKEKGEPPAPMMAIYEYLHEKHINKSAKIKAMQTMFSKG